MSLVRLDSIALTLGGFKVLADVSLRADPGEVVGVVGSNGSGKTTLLRVISTLQSPTAGGGSVLGAELGSTDVFGVRMRIGLISHLPAVIPELSLEENLAHAVRLAGGDGSRVPGALRAVGLENAATRKGTESSFGMLRRTEVARLLITKPDVLLLDEAFSGLDVEAASLIDALIDRSVGRSGSVIIVSHDQSHMDRASQVFGLKDGSLVIQR